MPRARTLSAMAGAPAQLDHPGLLPSVLVPREDGSTSRSTRDWLVDTAAFLLALGIAIGFLAEEDHRAALPEGQLAADALAGFLCCCALWLRRRHPVGVAAALTLPAAVFTSPSGAALIAFFTVAVHRPFRYVAVLRRDLDRLGLPLLRAAPGPDTPLLVSAAISTSITIAVAAWGMFVRARRQLVHSLRERAERAEAERQEHAERARLQERARIAREMHDVLAHRISLLSMHAGALEFRPGATPDEVARAAGVIRASAHQALEDLREVIGVLREAPDGATPERPQPTLADLPALVEESRAAGMVGARPAAGRRPRVGARGDGPQRVPDRPGGAHQRAPPRAGHRRRAHRGGRARRRGSRSRCATRSAYRPERAVPPGSGAGHHRPGRARAPRGRPARARPHPGRRPPALGVAPLAGVSAIARPDRRRRRARAQRAVDDARGPRRHRPSSARWGTATRSRPRSARTRPTSC